MEILTRNKVSASKADKTAKNRPNLLKDLNVLPCYHYDQVKAWITYMNTHFGVDRLSRYFPEIKNETDRYLEQTMEIINRK